MRFVAAETAVAVVVLVAAAAACCYSELMWYLSCHRSAETFCLIGHSTGCQNSVHWLKVCLCLLCFVRRCIVFYRIVLFHSIGDKVLIYVLHTLTVSLLLLYYKKI